MTCFQAFLNHSGLMLNLEFVFQEHAVNLGLGRCVTRGPTATKVQNHRNGAGSCTSTLTFRSVPGEAAAARAEARRKPTLQGGTSPRAQPYVFPWT